MKIYTHNNYWTTSIGKKMAIKKSELYSSLWKSCDELRGGMDASQYKDYVLVLLFIKYVSDKYAGEKYAPIAIPEGGSFQDMVALKGKKDIGEGINTIIAKLAKRYDSPMPAMNAQVDELEMKVNGHLEKMGFAWT
jgi:type I restriction-modification system DNA methylase subunit